MSYLDDPGLAALAAHGDLPLPQVKVAVSRILRVVLDPGKLGQPDPGGQEHRDDRSVPPLDKATARARLPDPDQFLPGEDRDQLLGDLRRT
jgi:hypothetical protein